MQAVDVILHGVWWGWTVIHRSYPLLISSWWGLAFLGFTAFNLSWVVFWWVYYRFGGIWHWLVRVWVATIDFIYRLPEFWFRFWDLAHEFWRWLCVVIPDIADWCGRWIYNLLHQEYVWARDGDIVGLVQSFVITACFGFVAYCCYTVWYGRGPLRVFWDWLRELARNPAQLAIAEPTGEPNSPQERERRRRSSRKD